MGRSIVLMILLSLMSHGAFSQELSESQTNIPNPKIAFLKSLVMPGWGHYYVDKSNWTRGQYHLAAEALLVISYLGLEIHSNNLHRNWYTYARSQAGVDIDNRDRSFQLDVGDFESLEAYNDYQKRSRNWDELYRDIPENRWRWNSTQDRTQYRNLRDQFETIERQLPALLSLMVVNRVISAISAYNQANKKHEAAVSAFLSSSPGTDGIVAHLNIRF